MTKEEFEHRKEFAKDLVEKRHLTAIEIGMILWETQCENCFYNIGVTRCEGKDCSIGVKLGANDNFEGVYDFNDHREVY